MNKKKSGAHGLSVLTVTLTKFLSDFLKVSIEGEEGMANLPVVHEVTPLEMLSLVTLIELLTVGKHMQSRV